MSQIKDAQSKIKDLKILIDNSIVTYTLNNFNSQFRPYLTILNYKTKQKVQLLTLFKLTKSLENKELRLKNKNTISAHFAKKAKLKSASHGSCINTGKKLIKDLDQKKEDCKTCDSNYKSDCQYLTVECFQYYEIGHILANYPENKEKKELISSDVSNNKPTTSKNLAAKDKSKKRNCFT